MSQDPHRVRVGTVAYLNAAPLTAMLDRDRYEVVADHPSVIARQLAEGEVDVALVPVAAALTDGDFRIVPGVCVGCDGPVHSVLLVAETPPEAWTTVRLDGVSRTSRTLARLLLTRGPLAERVRDDLEIVDVPPERGLAEAGGTVAALVIGDAAREVPARFAHRVDLGAAWKDWTGKPFVFAVWAGRPDLPAAVRRDLREAGSRGVARIREDHAGADRVYLTEHIRYPLDEPALIGLRRYAALAHEAGLIRHEHVQLFGPPRTRRPRRTGPAGWASALSALADGAAPDGPSLRLLAEDAPLAELGLAASLVRDAHHAAGEATYLAVSRPGDAVVRAGGEAFHAALAEAAEASLTALDLGSRPPSDVLVARSADAVAAGLQVLGPFADAVDAGVLAEAVQAGLGAVRWRPGAPGVDLDVPVHAHVGVPGTLERLVTDLLALRRAAVDGAPVVSVAVHLALPPGALVAPGAPTTSRWLRAVALARLALPARIHVTASPASQGLDLAQTALALGADDLGEVGPGRSDVLPDGEVFEATLAEAERVVRVAGLDAVRRDLAFGRIGGALTPLRRIRRPEERARLEA